MDTKSKNSKIIFSFLCFFLSMSILIIGTITGIYAALHYKRAVQYGKDAFITDYQNTDLFKQAISGQLEKMIDQLCGGSNSNEYSEEVGSSEYLDHDTGKNMLYQIQKLGTSKVFTNDSETKNLSTGDLPDGYNFRLYFDGKKVTITKDGKNIDVYGSGIYRSDSSMWYVPGYTNLSFYNSGLEDCRITILARKNLAEPFGGSSSLYNIFVQQRVAKTLIYTGAGVLIFEIILIALCFLLRKEKKLADLALAKFSGWFWFEFKALCTVILFYADVNLMHISLRSETVICFIFSLFCYYLVVNDMRYTRRFYSHNIFQSVLKYYRSFEEKKPFQKQLIFRFWLLLAAEVMLLLFAALVVSLGRLNDVSGPIFCLFIIGAMLYLIYRYIRRFQNTVNDVGRLIGQISLIRFGDMVTRLEIQSDADLFKAACELNTIQSGINNAVEERLKSERMKIDLITNVSHDIKTPLTSIIGYVDLLKEEENLPDHVKDYIQVLAEKSDRLKHMVQDIFDVSKATSGNMELKLEHLDLGKLLRQTLADMDEKIETSGLVFKLDIPESPVMISADGQRLYRVFQNLICNALQYSLEGSRVFVSLDVSGEKACASVKNISKFELDDQKDMSERFVRGDSSRSTSGSGLGLSIARSFTEACGGNFRISTDADLFKVDVEFNQVL